MKSAALLTIAATNLRSHMKDEQRPAGTPRSAMSRAPLPTASALIDEVAAILRESIARMVEANAMKDAERVRSPAEHMELVARRIGNFRDRTVSGATQCS